MSDFQQLRSDFQRPGISLVRGPANLTSVLLEHEGASARVSTYGAHVIDYQPRDQAPVLWLSSHAVFQAPKAIRGGIPICWPWFAENGTDAALPAHGFARTSEWTLVDSLSSREEKSVTLLLCDDACTRAMWPHPFELRYRVTVTERLCASLSVTNTGRQRMRFTGALHSYFDVLDIAQVSVEGLQGSTYVDKLDANCHKLQGEPRLRISSEVDRTYLDTLHACAVNDNGRSRKIHVLKTGSRTTVVWNPWVNRARQLGDFPNEGYRGMLCVETANAANDVIDLAPGASHTLAVSLEAVQV